MQSLGIKPTFRPVEAKSGLSAQPGAANSRELENFGANIARLDGWLARQGK
jgi:hypothetical protein